MTKKWNQTPKKDYSKQVKLISEMIKLAPKRKWDLRSLKKDRDQRDHGHLMRTVLKVARSTQKLKAGSRWKTTMTTIPRLLKFHPAEGNEATTTCRKWVEPIVGIVSWGGVASRTLRTNIRRNSDRN